MSIATLKRKTKTQYNNMSVGSQNGFSLNGTHRSQGWVGQSVLSRSLPKSLMNGTTLRGHGGCCGTYNNAPIVRSAVTSLNDENVVKPSSINTHAMIEEKYKPYHNLITVNPDSRQNTNTQQDHIDKVAKKALSDYNDCHNLYYLSSLDPGRIAFLPDDVQIKLGNLTISTPYVCTDTDRILRPSWKRANHCVFTKPKSDYLPVTSSDHLANLRSTCTQNDKMVVRNNAGGPLPGAGVSR
jgi:hypothetical protein